MWSTRRHSIQWFRRAVGKREIRARCCVCLAEAFLLAFVPAIGNVRAETLEEVLVKTYLSNPTLFAAREQLRVTNENLPQAIANWLPTISLTETKGRSVTKTIQEPPRTTAISKTQNASLAYTQNLYKGGINFATLRKARHQIANERANLRNTEQTVVSNAITAYMDVLRDRITRDHRRNNVEALKKRLETTQIQFDLRQRTLGALSQAQSRPACAEATFTAAESTLETSQATFLQVVGERAGDLVLPTELPPLPLSMEAAVEAARAENPAVLIAGFAVDIAKEDIDISNGARLPTLALSTTLSRNRTKTRGDTGRQIERAI